MVKLGCRLGLTTTKRKLRSWSLIGQKVYSLLRNFVVPMKPHDKKYDELVEAMKNHLKLKPLMIAERLKFNRRKQREEALLAELIKLAETCNFGAKLDEQLRDRLVGGLRSESIQKRLLSEGDIDLTRAYELTISIKTANQEASSMRNKSHEAGAAPVKHVAHVAQQNKPPLYRCGKAGHS